MASLSSVASNLLNLRPVFADFIGSWTYYILMAVLLLGAGGLLWFLHKKNQE